MNALLKLLTIVALLAGTINVQAQPGYSDRFADALQLYTSGNFDKAIRALKAIASDASLSNKEKKDVLIALGRAYVAKEDKENAFKVMTDLLALEPPLIAPDPETEIPDLMRIYYEARKAKKGDATIDTVDPGIQTIAILDFANRSIDDKAKYDPMEKGLAELMISHLRGAIKLKLVERERIQWLLDEIAMTKDPSKFDERTAVRVGRLLGVHAVMFGSIIKIKSKMELLARLVKVETGEILATERAGGDASDLLEIAEALSGKIARTINVDLQTTTATGTKETKSLDAMLQYSEGLVELEKRNYKEAYDKFMKALEFDPGYSKAKHKAESIKPLAG